MESAGHVTGQSADLIVGLFLCSCRQVGASIEDCIFVYGLYDTGHLPWARETIIRISANTPAIWNRPVARAMLATGEARILDFQLQLWYWTAAVIMTAQIARRRMHGPILATLYLLPPCSWCGMPTGLQCHWCGRPMCSTCMDAIRCRKCSGELDIWDLDELPNPRRFFQHDLGFPQILSIPGRRPPPTLHGPDLRGRWGQ